MIRAFIALPLPGETREALAMLQHMLPLSRRVPPENMHLTLAFLGDLDDETLEAVHDGLQAIAAPPIELKLAGVGTFGGDKPRSVHAQVAPGPELDALQAKVARAARSGGAQVASRSFVPHVTLSRERPRGPDLMRLEQGGAALSGWRAPPVRVEEFCLYRSDLGGGPARYTPLACYPLTG
ncbi:RNA 2',3'-cyclic phosphodiesterase [Tranquillimonas alkanivorans]|uniref:RNA 2',3'-cyclic phosphodiesterase n=1 Tax=Tranquillimonas alkanivorans TaxID=441119 RepID=A0A1I5M799_9RHOB|nr:RNA 2',3'-cyclic phosphodiesterase [Tranquillimonas alkanivorans]SFP05454.1 2'-5' RNA ligase [Tranquillimonas alkanivorans]